MLQPLQGLQLENVLPVAELCSDLPPVKSTWRFASSSIFCSGLIKGLSLPGCPCWKDSSLEHPQLGRMEYHEGWIWFWCWSHGKEGPKASLWCSTLSISCEKGAGNPGVHPGSAVTPLLGTCCCASGQPAQHPAGLSLPSLQKPRHQQALLPPVSAHNQRSCSCFACPASL